MKSISSGLFNSNSLICLEDNSWLVNQRVAGKILRNVLNLLDQEIKNKTQKSMLELNSMAEKFIYDSGGECTFKNYKGFPCGVCISINSTITHGIPSEYHLKDGDKVSFDIGVTYNGSIADAAITCVYGENKEYEKIAKVTEECLDKAIEVIKVGEKIGVIGNAIYKHAKLNDYLVLEDYGGHGICCGKAHAAPFISNKSKPEEGIRIQPGMVLAIEPLLTKGTNSTRVLSDGWSVETSPINSHFEKTVYVHENYVEVIT